MSIPSPDELAHAQKLCDEATPGEWYWLDASTLLSSIKGKPVVLHSDVTLKVRDERGLLEYATPEHPNLTLIAYARNEFPRYINALRELQAENERLKQTITRQAPKE